MASLKSAVESGNTATMKSAIEALMQARHKVAEALYKQAGAGAGAEGAAGGPTPGGNAKASEGDVIDAEVVEDEKK